VNNQKRHLRFSLVFLSCIFGLVIFAVKLVFIQVFNAAYLAKLAEKQHNYFIELEPRRGGIYDRKLRPLALNVAAYSLYAKPRAMTVQAKKKAIKEIDRLLDLGEDFLKKRLDKDKYFVWIVRKLTSADVATIKALKIDGLDFVKESRRYYPNQSLGAHVIGFAGMDNRGLEGVELIYDHYLKGEFGWSQIIRDARHRELLIEKGFIPPKNGFDFILTIDETIQFIAERALEEGFRQHHAIGASLIIMDPKTGEILALANRPTYDLSHFSEGNQDSRRNRAIVDMYEPGSVFKIVTAAAALEDGKVKESDKFFCENGEYKVGGHILHDHSKHGTLTFKEVIEQSSNIGTTKVAQLLGPVTVYKYAKLFRFGMPTGINLIGEVNGVLRHPSQWSKTSIAAIPIGHEVTVTAIQLLGAISAIANDGVYMQPFVVKYIKDQEGELIKEFKPQAISRVISGETARRLKEILAGVVENGTGKLSKIPNVRVAGKTGTAQKVLGGQYSHNKFYASFIGFAPVEDPQIAMVVIFDEPHPSYYGGTVAAPVFKRVAEDVLKYLAASK